MKKLLCVLMFGMVFGQDTITTREYNISITGEETNINIMELIGVGEGNYFVEIMYIENAVYENNGYNLEIVSDSGMNGGYGWDMMMQGSYYCPFQVSNDFPTITTSSSNGWFSSGNMILHISGKFDEDVGLQGDMNDDDNLDVLDVVVMVEIILGGGMGDVGDLLNTVTG